MLVSVCFCSSLAGYVLGQSEEATLFFDNFESYPVGIFYPPGGWQLLWGSAYVTDLRSYAGTRSLLMNDSTVLRWFGVQNAESVGYEVAVYAEGRGQGGFGVMFANRNGIVQSNTQCGDCDWAGVNFLSANMSIWAGDGNQVRVLQPWKPGLWYLIKVVLSAPTYTYDVWINNTAVAENLKPYSPHGELVDSIILRSRGGMNVYFDNVRVFADFSPVSTIAPGLSSTAQLVRSLSPYEGFVAIGPVAARIIVYTRNRDWLGSDV